MASVDIHTYTQPPSQPPHLEFKVKDFLKETFKKCAIIKIRILPNAITKVNVLVYKKQFCIFLQNPFKLSV